MTNSKTTKRALFSSVVALLLCFTMLLGTTFAWFTDTVTNGVNKIVSGNLDIELYHSDYTTSINDAIAKNITATGFGFYGEEKDSYRVEADTKLFLNEEGKDILWEPGATSVETFRIKNHGSLALEYKFMVEFANATKTPTGKTLADIINISADALGYDEYGVGYGISGAAAELADRKLADGAYVFEGVLLPGEFFDFWVGLQWVSSDIDNEFNVEGGLSIDFGVTLLATQHTYEKDNYDGDQYDAGAQYPEVFYVNNPTELIEAIKNAPNNATIYMKEGVYEITSQINIDGKSVNIVGSDNTTIKLTRTGKKVFYIYGSKVEGNDGINVTISNVKIEGNSAKSDIWVRTWSGSCRGDVNLTLDNVECETIIADNNYSNDTIVNINVKNSKISRKITLDASPFNNNGFTTYTNLTYDAASNINSIMIQDSINDAGMANITINGVTVTARGEQLD